MKEMSGVQITMAFWKSIMSTIPDFFEVMERFKNYSYYYDTVMRDLKHTDEMMIVTPPDELTKTLELELQKKGIPFVKSTAETLPDNIKASGFYVYCCRTVDYDRLYKTIEEINEKVLAGAEQTEESKNTDEHEHSRDEEKPEKDDGKENDTDCEKKQEQEGQEEPDELDELEDESEFDTKNKKKQKKKSAYNKEQDAANREWQEQEQRRQSDRESYESLERERVETFREQVADTQSRETIRGKELIVRESESQIHERQERRDQESERYSGFESERLKHAEHEEARPQPERGDRAKRSDGAESNANISAGFGSHGGFYHTDEKIQENESFRESNQEIRRSNAGPHTQNSSSPILHTSENLETKENYAIDAQHPSKGCESQGYPEASDVSRENNDFEHQTPWAPTEQKNARDDRQKTQRDAESRGHVERSALAGGNRNTAVDFTHRNAETTQSVSDRGPSSDVQILGTAATYNNEIPTHTHSGIIRQPYNAYAGNAAAYLGDESQGTNKNINTETIKINRQVKALDGDQTIADQDVQKVLRNRTINDAKNALSPEHFKQLQKATRRIVAQTVVSRETDGGRVANQVIDNTSPIAAAMLATMMSNGAMNLTKETMMDHEVLIAFNMAATGNSRQDAEGALRFLTRAAIDGDNAGTGAISMYAFDRAFYGNIEELGERMEKLRDQISNLQTKRILTDSDKNTIAELTQELERLKGQQFLAQFQKNFLADGPDGFGLRAGESFSDWFGRASTEDILQLTANLNISDGLRKDLAELNMSSEDILVKLAKLKEKYRNNPADMAVLDNLTAGIAQKKFHVGPGGIARMIRKGFQKNLLKAIAGQSDAGRALGDANMFVTSTYMAYRAGMKLFLHTLRQFGAIRVDADGIASMFGKQVSLDVLDAIKNPFGAAKKKAGERAAKNLGKALDKIGVKNSLIQTRRAIINHASSALKFLTKPITKPAQKLIVKLGLDKVAATASKALTSFVAKASVTLGWILVVVLIILLLGEAVDSQRKVEDSGPANGIYIDNEIIQEITTELTQKNNQFMADINDAANHRGEYSVTTGLVTNENATTYESYNVIFRDAMTGVELTPEHVDLNNTKAILAMAQKFMPYPLVKPGENATAEAKKEYEDMAQHFKDYCYYLWAATHQISIEEYHPGNSTIDVWICKNCGTSNASDTNACTGCGAEHTDEAVVTKVVEGAVDTSEMQTTYDKGKCDKDGTIVWLTDGFEKNIIHWGEADWVCDSCDDVPSDGYGEDGSDLCNNGKNNEHGGWKRTGNKRKVYNCQADHNKVKHDDDVEYYDCEELKKDNHWHYEYEWKYECAGHMAAVVYVTIGDLSRDPSFPAAKDVNYDKVGNYDSVSDSETTESTENQEETETATESITHD